MTSEWFDFRATRGFARAYLHTYYSGAPPIDEQVVSRFLVREAKRLRGGTFVEIGCGPTIHHALPLVAHVDAVHFLDYLAENQHEIELWRRGAPTAHDWRPFTRMSLIDAGVEPTPTAVAAHEALLRARIARVGACNLLAPTPAADVGAFAAVGCFYCAEEVGISKAAWAQVMARVAAYVRPGGTLFVAALAGMDAYRVEDALGRTTELPCANITADDVRALLPRLGFPAFSACIEQHDIPHPDVGVTGTILVAAEKTAAGKTAAEKEI